MTLTQDIAPNQDWKNRSFAFLVRSRQELWGKHNEDILAWFFKEGFRNSFIHDMLLGWNRHARIRPAKNWGLSGSIDSQNIRQQTFILPAGIVIPYIVNQDIRKLLFYDHESTSFNRCTALPGGSTEPIILGKDKTRVAVIFNIIHGLFIHQEIRDKGTVIVPHPGCDILSDRMRTILASTKQPWVFPDPFDNTISPMFESLTDINPGAMCVRYDRSEDILKTIISF